MLVAKNFLPVGNFTLLDSSTGVRFAIGFAWLSNTGTISIHAPILCIWFTNVLVQEDCWFGGSLQMVLVVNNNNKNHDNCFE